VSLKFRDATLDDVAVIAGLPECRSRRTYRRVLAPVAGLCCVNERGVALAQRHGRMRIGRNGKHIFTVLRLAPKKPWAIDVSYFTPVKRPLYLTGMAVSVEHQGQGLGRLALQDAWTVAHQWPADAIRLDAYDAKAGAGAFYARCGFTERGRVVYKGRPTGLLRAPNPGGAMRHMRPDLNSLLVIPLAVYSWSRPARRRPHRAGAVTRTQLLVLRFGFPVTGARPIPLSIGPRLPGSTSPLRLVVLPEMSCMSRSSLIATRIR